MIFVCNHCEKPINAPQVIEAELEGYPDITEGALMCDSCGYMYHAYFLNKHLIKLRSRLSKLADRGNMTVWQKKKAEYSAAYDALQAELMNTPTLAIKAGDRAVIYVSTGNNDN